MTQMFEMSLLLLSSGTASSSASEEDAGSPTGDNHRDDSNSDSNNREALPSHAHTAPPGPHGMLRHFIFHSYTALRT